ncbi:MAG: hypothetical protein ABF649_06250 [Bacillus sp. (in: firmicutes)]
MGYFFVSCGNFAAFKYRILYFVALLTPSPEVTSDNGNLGIFFVIFAANTFVQLSNCLWKILSRLNWKLHIWKIVSLGSLAIFLIGCFLQYRYAVNLIDQLGGPVGKETSRIYGLSWVNQYTNTLFLNIYTFFILNSMVVFLFTIIKKKYRDSFNEESNQNYEEQ